MYQSLSGSTGASVFSVVKYSYPRNKFAIDAIELEIIQVFFPFVQIPFRKIGPI